MSPLTRAQRFAAANDLWFEQGYTERALELYRALAAEDPTDPLVLYQLSRASWALDEFDEARVLADAAFQNRGRLSERGLKRLDEWRASIAGPAPHRPGVQRDLLDVELLERRNAPAGQWQAAAAAARRRELYGVAAEALARGYQAADRDAPREIEDARLNADLDRDLLETMADPPLSGTGQSAPARTAPPPPRRHGTTLPPPARMRARGAFASGESHAEPLRELPPLPLRLEVAVEPAVSALQQRPELHVRLSNPTSELVVVNHRLLLVPSGTPDEFGELTVRVSGPPGYKNLRHVHVRSGSPRPEHFAVLNPGEAVERVLRLWRYQSLHLPGRYSLSLTYRNTITFRVMERAALVGAVSARTTFERI